MRTDTTTPDDARIEAFRTQVLGYYHEHGRSGMPWRETRDPYRVWVSEAMLQQTQVARVLPRYEAWLERFPTVDSLAAAPLGAVLEAWQGLGYNRRAVALKRAAEEISSHYEGRVPDDQAALLALPGIGPATAAGILVFAYDQPARYLETNVRAAFLHEFFADCDAVADREIVPLLDRALPDPAQADARTWYYALMDWGAHLKRTQLNPSRRSRHHSKQSAFEGSHRQKRARALRAVIASPGMTIGELAVELGIEHGFAESLAEELAGEGFLTIDAGRAFIAR